MLFRPLHPGLGALGALPPEILEQILFLLVAQTPLGPPAALIPLLLASRALKDAASSPALLMRVFRLKFDTGAVERRLFLPGAREMDTQLVWACRVLRSLRRGLPARPGEEEADGGMGLGCDEGGLEEARRRERDPDMGVEDALFGALLLMLDNDGRNYAQLEHAGVHAYVAAYVSRRLWDGARDNGGWPVESVASACALWVMWMTTDRERLMAETPLERENVVLSILPFVFLIHRYPASEAPPNHFHLPLRDASAAVSRPLPHAPRSAFYPELTEGFAARRMPVLPEEDDQEDEDQDQDGDDARSEPDADPTPSTSTSAPSRSPTPTPARLPAPQHYPHYLPPRALTTPYFRALPQLAPPLASIAAKLLFASRREVRPFGVPQHLPRDREDAERRWWGMRVEAERAAAAAAQNHGQGQAPGAQLHAQVQLPLPIPPMPPHIQPPPVLGPTQADYRALNRGKAAALPRGARWDWDAGCARAVNQDFGEDGLDADAALNGVSVTRRGRRKGKEQEAEESKKWDTLWWRMRLCGDFHEPQPRFAPGAVFERGCMKGMWQGKIYIPQGNSLMQLIGQNPQYPGIPDAHGHFSEASLGVIMQPVFLEMEEHVRVCGCSKPSTPTRSPHHTTRGASEEAPTEEELGESDQPHAHEHDACGVIPVPPLSGIADWRGVPFAGVLPADLPAGHPQHGPPPPPPPAPVAAAANNTNSDFDSSVMAADLPPQPLDYSMSNAWFPGGIGDLAWAARPAEGGPPLVVRRKDGGGFLPVEVDEEGKETIRRRDEIVVSTTGRAPDVLRAPGGCKAFMPPTSSSSSSPPTDGVPEECYVYETYDPARVSAHDVRYESAPYVGPSRSWPADDRVVVGVVDPEALEDGEEVVNLECAACVEREAARREERAKEERRGRRALERRAALACEHADADVVLEAPLHVASERSPGKREIGAEGRSLEREAKRRRVEEQDFDRTEDATAARAEEAQRQLEEMMRNFKRPGDEEGDVDVEMDSTVEELDVDGFGLCLDDEEDVHMEEADEQERQDLEDEDEEEDADDADQISVLGDDFPFGQPGLWTDASATTAKRTYIPRTRREFARARITSIRTPCAHAGDTLFTGHTPACGLAWGQRYTTYGRLRPWDGLVGLVRVGRNPVNFIFIFGYVVGGRTFVGEWRVAASDPMRPAWGAAFVMSRVGA